MRVEKILTIEGLGIVKIIAYLDFNGVLTVESVLDSHGIETSPNEEQINTIFHLVNSEDTHEINPDIDYDTE